MRFTFIILTLFIGFLACNQKTNPGKTVISEQSADSIKIDSLTKLILSNPGNATYYAERSEIYTKTGKLEEAVKDLIFTNSIDSLNPDPYLKLADFYLQLGKSEIVNEVLQRGNRLIPNNKDILYNLGNLYFFIREYKQAVTYLNQAIKIDNYFAEAYFTRGLIYGETGNMNLAIENMQIATDRNPDYYDAFMQLGLIFAENGDSIALQYYDNALRVIPNSYDARYGKAMFYQETDKVEQALEIYNAMLNDLSRDLPEMHFNIGYIQMIHYENYNMAIQQFDTAIIQYPKYIDAIYNKGFCYEQIGNNAQAILLYQQAVDLSANYELAVAGIKRLNK